MAEAAVGWAINKLDTLLTGELILLRDVHTKLRDVKHELETIKSFLRDADAKLYQENMDSQFEIWVKQVRQVTFHIEDVIDEYVLHLGRHQDQHGCFHKLTHAVKNLKPRHHLASKIQAIKQSIGEIRERCDRYNLNFSSEHESNDWHSVRHDPRLASLFIEEAELVGIESPKAELISRLVEGTSRIAAISVVGMGGLGKTTLAKKAYDSETVAAHFDCKAWITVSQTYKMEELLRTTIQQFIPGQKLPPLEGINDTMEKLRECVSDKMYLVVFDDVWSRDFWRYVKIALPDNDNGSRVIITTRNEGVAPSPNESPCYHVHKLQPLQKPKAYELFCKKAFQSNGGNCPLELQELSHAIVEKCEGLALGIVTTGDQLATRDKTVEEWKKFYDGFSSSLASDQCLSNITKILALSYHDLPYYLKSCFLYLSVFPEDYSISCWRLIRLWIAEGFVKEMQGKTLEEVAQEHLTELIQRSLVQVARVSVDGKARECRVHDLMREIILSRSKELSFDQVLVENYQIFKGRIRHISINGKTRNASESSNNDWQTHSIVLFGVNELPKSMVCSLVENVKLLRSLDFEGAPLDFIPNELGNLWHLRYLSLKDTRVKVLPKSIGKLCNLETLDLRQSYVQDLPTEINRLLKLRHLLAHLYKNEDEFSPNYYRGVKMHGDIGCLKALQKLGIIEVDHDMGLINQLERLTQLRKLKITKLKRESGLALCSALEKMIKLQTVYVSSGNEEVFLNLQSISDPPPQLQNLYLYGPLIQNELPQWIPEVMSLVRIALNWSRLGDDGVQALQALPNLQQLSLYNGYNRNKLHFKKEGFQKLRELHLQSLMELNEVMIDEEALPVLEELWIGPCPELKEVPSGIHFLKNLKNLRFYDIQREFAINIQPNGGQDYWIVEHIQIVFFYYKITGFRYAYYKLGDLDLLNQLNQVSV